MWHGKLGDAVFDKELRNRGWERISKWLTKKIAEVVIKLYSILFIKSASLHDAIDGLLGTFVWKAFFCCKTIIL